MGDCGCGIHEAPEEGSNSDPSLENYKSALKNLGNAIKSAHKTEEGKKLSAEYWTDIIGLLKKAKLGVSMMELGIDDESEIATTHHSKETEQPSGEAGGDDAEAGGDDDASDKKKKLAAVGLKKESVESENLCDIMNHLSILLSEHSFDNIESSGSEVSIDTNNRRFTIKFDDKFFMVSENYNFELGTTSDLKEVVDMFVKLNKHSDSTLKKDYEASL